MWIAGLRGCIIKLLALLEDFPAILSKPVACEGLISPESFRTVSGEVGTSANGSEMLKCW